jgi:hypothetical protein
MINKSDYKGEIQEMAKENTVKAACKEVCTVSRCDCRKMVSPVLHSVTLLEFK